MGRPGGRRTLRGSEARHPDFGGRPERNMRALALSIKPGEDWPGSRLETENGPMGAEEAERPS